MSKKTLKVLSLLLVMVFALVTVTGCGGGNGNGEPAPAPENGEPEAAGEGEIVLRAATSVDMSHPYNQGMIAYGEMLEERTNGKFSIEVYPDAQLGSEREIIEGIQMGTIDVTVVSTAPLAGFSDAFLVTDLPFIFEDKPHAYRVLDGEIGQSIFDQLEGTGIVGLAFWENGFRNITNSQRPIEVPEDVQGLKIRTMENQIHMDSFREVGADPTPMAFGELFTALQQGTVDGQENPLPIIATSRFYEVQDHLALTGHFYAPAPLLISGALWDSLTDEEKTIFQEAANDATDIQRGMIQEMDDRLVEELEAEGMQITRPDVGPWQEAMAPVYEQWEDTIGAELIQQIQEMGN
ncbi:MAG: DctP family TRAP transporter solute-binding subunit [Tindallia sp. MSAO_Bac2]|nr:MAG: DctP family TRAP transporter solute-binding subunit [Tindallia sp. MSAO_Bac2]